MPLVDILGDSVGKNVPTVQEIYDHTETVSSCVKWEDNPHISFGEDSMR